MSITSAAGLVDALRKQHILGPVQLDVADDLQRRFPEAHALATELLVRGWVTDYQANQLLQGHGAELVLGAYLLLERLGQGGMGQVFKARHQFMNRIVALKIIRQEYLANPESIRRFHQEVLAVAQLNHPNIVIAHDAACLGDVHFLVMEYIEGVDLARLLKQLGVLPIAQACDLAHQVALGLQHAHEKGLVHRDIKPGNLMVTPQGVVKILDLGLARLRADYDSQAVTPLTKEGAVLGTTDYMAPEQALDSNRVDIRADLYSLGCVLYHFLTGQPPFPRGSHVGKALAHQQETPVAVHVLRPDVPLGLVEVVSRLLAKKPADRYQVPEQVAQVLLPFARSAPVPLELFPERDSTSSVGEGTQPSPSSIPDDQDVAPTVTEESSFTQVRPPSNRPQHRLGWRITVAALGVVGCGLALTAAILYLDNTSDQRDTTPPDEPPPSVINQKPRPGDGPTVIKPPAPASNFTNSVGMKLVLIPKGKFLMGSPVQEQKRQINEPQHEVSITRPYYLGAFEVTQEQYQAVMDRTPSHFSRQGPGKLYVQMIAEDDLKRFPVENVTWEDAVTFCRKLSALPEEKRLGRAYRLPTEAEWEHACRAGAPASPFHFGSQLASTEANFFGGEPYGGAAKGPYLSRTAAVGSYKPNAWGLYDMHGNVWEWCSDWQDGTAGPGPIEDPRGPDLGKLRCARGGSWGNPGWDCRSACRGGFDPNKGYPHVGFRVACTTTP